ERIGVWVGERGGERKIASIGIHLARWRTTHGFALNASTDLALFDGIVACGMPEVRMTSIARETGSAPTVETLAALFVEEFARRFERDLVRDEAFAAERARTSA